MEERLAAEEIKGAEGAVDEAQVRRKYRAFTRAMIRLERSVTTMESCTSGQVASLITDTEGASAIMKGAFITYSNEAKIRLGVPARVIREYGVYSAETALAMAQVARAAYGADLGMGITGSFGNVDPKNADSVPGEVYFALATAKETCCFHCTVPPQPSRLAYKLYMAEVMVDTAMSGRISFLRDAPEEQA